MANRLGVPAARLIIVTSHHHHQPLSKLAPSHACICMPQHYLSLASDNDAFRELVFVMVTYTFRLYSVAKLQGTENRQRKKKGLYMPLLYVQYRAVQKHLPLSSVVTQLFHLSIDIYNNVPPSPFCERKKKKSCPPVLRVNNRYAPSVIVYSNRVLSCQR